MSTGCARGEYLCAFSSRFTRMRSACTKSKRPTSTGSDHAIDVRSSRPENAAETCWIAAPTTSSAAFSSARTGSSPAFSRERSSRSATMRLSRSACCSIVAARSSPLPAMSCASALIVVSGVRRSCDTDASSASFSRSASRSASARSASATSRTRSRPSAA